MPLTPDALAAVSQIAQHSTWLRDHADTASDADVQNAWNNISEGVGKLSQLLPFAGKVDLPQFFQQLGTAVAGAQRLLDAESEKYIEEVRDKPHLLPSIFRIPKVSADIKFAFQRDVNKNLNLVFYSAGSKISELNQQSVQFEIVAAPLPIPEAKKPPATPAPGPQPPLPPGGAAPRGLEPPARTLARPRAAKKPTKKAARKTTRGKTPKK